MEPAHRYGVCYQHKGQEEINLYKLFPKSTVKRRQVKIKFMRNGIIHISFYGNTIFVLNPQIQNVFASYKNLDEYKIIKHITACIIHDGGLEFPTTPIEAKTLIKFTYHHTYSELNLKTNICKKPKSITYKTYINKQ